MSVLDGEAAQYHLNITPAQGGRYAIVTGDPARVEGIARRLDSPAFVASAREYTTWSGELDGARVLVTSHGIGAPSAAIAVHELNACGVDTIIRVGTCGGMDERVRAGDLVIASCAIRGDGTGVEYLPIEFPAASDFRVTTALHEAAPDAHIGVVQSKDSFYSQHSPENMPVSEHLAARWRAYIRGGCLASEMECAAIFIVAQTLGIRAGGLLLAVWNQERAEKYGDTSSFHDMDKAVDAAVRAMKILIERDKGSADGKE